MNTDGKILRAILNSNSSPTKPGTSNQNETEENIDSPVLDINVIKKISESYTRILLYQVCKEAHQRYSVRLNVIESLREFSKVKGNFGNLPIFQDSEKSYSLLINTLMKYLPQEAVCKCDNVDHLVQAAELLQNCLPTNKSVMNCFKRVVGRIIEIEQTKKSKLYLQALLRKSDDLKVDSCLVEQIYINQKSWLIDELLTVCFAKYYFARDKLEFTSDINVLFEKIIDNPSLFELVALKLKDIFVETEYSKESQDFIQKILDSIQTHCSKYHKDTLDLYPTHLQFCVILLRINLADHSEKSKNHTVKSLKQIFLKSETDALILVSHFPHWLPDYLKFFDILDELLESSKNETCNVPMIQD